MPTMATLPRRLRSITALILLSVNHPLPRSGGRQGEGVSRSTILPAAGYAIHRERHAFLGDGRPGAPNGSGARNLVHCRIVVAGVVMEQDQLPDGRRLGECHA